MEEEIPRKLVMVVLIIAIVLSILGTWITLDALSSKNEIYYSPPASGGKVGFTILSLENNSDSKEANKNG
ncbi:MAG TPA: hypothetical protein VJB94_01785 [Candidatus Nanoarchaeia archaeon]|nr:hypothetical protein [Candidatus Nanoarchaeia archaeon]